MSEDCVRLLFQMLSSYIDSPGHTDLAIRQLPALSGILDRRLVSRTGMLFQKFSNFRNFNFHYRIRCQCAGVLVCQQRVGVRSSEAASLILD